MQVSVSEKEQLLIEYLMLSKAGEAAQMLVFIWLKTEEQKWEMCRFLRYNPDATEGQILWKTRQILGEEW